MHSAAAIRANRTRVLQKNVLQQLHRISQVCVWWCKRPALSLSPDVHDARVVRGGGPET